MTSLLDYLLYDPGLTTEEYEHDLDVRRRMNCLPPSMPANSAELRQWLGVLQEQGLVACEDGRWSVVMDRLPVGPWERQESLF